MSGPELSVVVPAVNELTDVLGCLDALEREGSGVRLDVLVINRLGQALASRVHQSFPAARVIDVAATVTIPQMRARAFEAAAAPAIAVIEDHVIVPPGWARALLTALGTDTRVVGGAVRNAATGTVLDWAAFLCEYSHCLPPLPAGQVEWLTGNNVVYPTALLERYRTIVADGHWENHLHDALRRDGIPLVCHPEIVVGHKKHYTFGEYFSQRYLYSRSYAGARMAGAPPAKRAAYALASLALPPLLFYRTVSRIARKGQHLDWLVKSAPLLALFVLAWGWGEAAGSWRGPGDSLSRVR